MCKFVLIVRSYLDNNYVHSQFTLYSIKQLTQSVHTVLNKTADTVSSAYNVIVMFL